MHIVSNAKKQPNANKYAYDIVVKYLYLLFFDLKLSILCSSGVIPCALLTSMSHGSQYATLLPAFHPSTSSFCSKTEHWLQIGILHFKHSYFVFIKHEQHISILLELKCDVFNAFLNLALSGPISFPEPTCLLVSTKTRSSGIIN